MDEKESKGTLLNRVLGRIMNKDHSPKAWKRLAGLVLAGVIGVTVTACDSSTAVDDPAKNSSSKYEDSSNLDSSYDDSSSVDEPPIIDVDYSKFSPIIQAMFNNDYYVNLTQKIQENVAKQDYTDYYSHPTKFWDSVGIDANKIRSGEIECHTNAYVWETDLNKLYIMTYITDFENNCYDQYLLKYTLTDQEMKEYFALRKAQVWQNFYMNDILSLYKTPEVTNFGKIDIQSHKKINDFFVQRFPGESSFRFDFIVKFEKELDGKNVLCATCVKDKNIYKFYGLTETAGYPLGISQTLKNVYFTLNENVECSTQNGILYLDCSAIENDKDILKLKHIAPNFSGWEFLDQEQIVKEYTNNYSELKEEHLAEFLEKVNEKSENK